MLQALRPGLRTQVYIWSCALKATGSSHLYENDNFAGKILLSTCKGLREFATTIMFIAHRRKMIYANLYSTANAQKSIPESCTHMVTWPSTFGFRSPRLRRPRSPQTQTRTKPDETSAPCTRWDTIMRDQHERRATSHPGMPAVSLAQDPLRPCCAKV